MEKIAVNLSGKVREAKLGGRDYLVAPLTLIVPGVLNGSQGPLYYPPEEIAKNPSAWNHVPIVVYHPQADGQNISGRDPDVLNTQGIGLVLKAHTNGKLTAEGWFDVVATRRVEPRVLADLKAGRALELSTGLFTDNEPAAENSNHNGKPYAFIARNYRPDHLAVLPDGTGACSIADGCGVLVNERRLVGQTGIAQGHRHSVEIDEEGFGWTLQKRDHNHRIKSFKVLRQWQDAVGADNHVHTLDQQVLIDSGVSVNKEGRQVLTRLLDKAFHRHLKESHSEQRKPKARVSRTIGTIGNP